MTVGTTEPDEVRPAPGRTPERMAMFTDAIFAIAMTLLVIEIKRPEGAELDSAQALWDFLKHEGGSFFAFGLAFFLLWSVWRRHHVLMDQIERLTPALTFWHSPMLLLVAFLPFPTALIGKAFDNPLAVFLFAITEASLLACEALLKETAYRSPVLSAGTDPRDVRGGASASWAVAALFVVTSIPAWWFTNIAMAWMGAPFVATYGGRLIERFRGQAERKG